MPSTPQWLADIAANTRTLAREGGRRLAYLDLGDPSGRPLFAFHGTPGSRLEFVAWDAVARARGVRIIAPDRPGIGASEPQPGRRVLDWPVEVAALADELGLERFAVLGMSGGGPAVYACAHSLGRRVEACFALAAATPLYRDRSAVAQLSRIDRWFAALGTRLPEPLVRVAFWLLGRSLARARDGEQIAELLGDAISQPDRVAAGDPALGQLLLSDVRESYAQGAAGPTWDALLIYRDWGFALAELRTPTFLRHGREDRLMPLAFSRYAAAEITGAELDELPGAGHYVHMADPEATFDWLLARWPATQEPG